ncbi:MAG: 3-deoxy-manno-octulosonate cytidylyltransferase [Gemmatimonadaceae bacterium]|nr:3-deoxy-manno-octulosonate cytidylyltransferase [Gemmatimonadaceae bacterium]
MQTLAVIPARLGATRLPRKPLRLLGGAPLVFRVWERVRQMAVADRVVVATDSEEVAASILSHGGEVAMTRSDHPSGTDRVAEVAARREFSAYETIVNVQGDEPFVSGAAVRGAADLVRSRRFPLATVGVFGDVSILDEPNVVKVVCADDGRALYFSRARMPFLRDPADRPLLATVVRQHIGVYAYAREALRAWVALPVHPLERIERLEQLRPLAAGMPIGVYMIDAPLAAGVDTEDDLRRANERWSELHTGRS